MRQRNVLLTLLGTRVDILGQAGGSHLGRCQNRLCWGLLHGKKNSEKNMDPEKVLGFLVFFTSKPSPFSGWYALPGHVELLKPPQEGPSGNHPILLATRNAVQHQGHLRRNDLNLSAAEAIFFWGAKTSDYRCLYL